MPYLRGGLDRDCFPEEAYWFLAMGPLQALSVVELQDKGNNGHLKPSVSRETNGEHIEDDDSESPTPPETPSTPHVTTTPCPVRLSPLIPPTNYGVVEPFTIYRSGKPMNCNVNFLESLKIQSMLTLVDLEIEYDQNEKVSEFLSIFGIDHETVLIQKNKGELKTTIDSLCRALLFIMNPINHPVYIHCNMGKHRTGCVVACLRKCQQWPIDEVLAEYMTYAADKAREKDIELIQNFRPVWVYEYAKERKMLDFWPREPRQDLAADIWQLAASLPAHELSQLPKDDEFDEIEDEDKFDSGDDPTTKHPPITFNDISNVSPANKDDGYGDEIQDDDVQMTESTASAAADKADCAEETVALYRTTSTPALVVSASGTRIYCDSSTTQSSDLNNNGTTLRTQQYPMLWTCVGS